MVTPYSQLTPQQTQQIIYAFNNRMQVRTIPCQLGVSERAVSRVLVEAGINTKRRNRYTLNENHFDVIDSHTKAYLLGLIAADGCVTSTNYVAFESVDRELTQRLKSELQYSGEIRIVKPQGYAPHYRINFSSKKLATALSKWGVVAGRGSLGLCYFPRLEHLAAYVLGYFDGDGCAYVSKGRSGGSICIVGSFEFTRELKRLLRMGFIAEHCSKQVYYWKIYSRKNIEAFYDLVYKQQGLGLQRKKRKIEEILGSYRRSYRRG